MTDVTFLIAAHSLSGEPVPCYVTVYKKVGESWGDTYITILEISGKGGVEAEQYVTEAGAYKFWFNPKDSKYLADAAKGVKFSTIIRYAYTTGSYSVVAWFNPIVKPTDQAPPSLGGKTQPVTTTKGTTVSMTFVRNVPGWDNEPSFSIKALDRTTNSYSDVTSIFVPISEPGKYNIHSINASYEADVPDHPVQDGYISDNALMNPIELELDTTLYDNRGNQLQQLKDLQSVNTLFKISCDLHTALSNCVITSINPQVSEGSINTFPCKIRFKQIRIASVSAATLSVVYGADGEPVAVLTTTSSTGKVSFVYGKELVPLFYPSLPDLSKFLNYDTLKSMTDGRAAFSTIKHAGTWLYDNLGKFYENRSEEIARNFYKGVGIAEHYSSSVLPADVDSMKAGKTYSEKRSVVLGGKSYSYTFIWDYNFTGKNWNITIIDETGFSKSYGPMTYGSSVTVVDSAGNGRFVIQSVAQLQDKYPMLRIVGI